VDSFEAARSGQTFEAMRSAQSGRDAIILKFAAPQNANEARGEKRADCPKHRNGISTR